jgi:hypothetical protein
MHISPTAICGKNPLPRQVLLRSMGEKKVPYSGKIFFENAEDHVIEGQPLQEYQVAVVVENTGKESWPKDVRLCCVNGNYRNRQEDLIPLDPGTKQILHLQIQAPAQAGRYLSQWKLYYNDEEKVRSFGESLFIEMQVEDKSLRYSKSNKDEALERLSMGQGRNTLTLRRGNTFSDAYSNRIEEKRKAEKSESYDKKQTVAIYLNEIFPGRVEEKLEFLDKGLYNFESEDLSRVVELYLQNLSKERRSCKGNNNENNQELLYTLS